MKKITIIGADFVKTTDAVAFGKKDLEVDGGDRMSVSDGFHTMDELYDHRIGVYIALCRAVCAITTGQFIPVWRSKRHSDGELCFGTGTQYVVGIESERGKQITYHIPIERWDETSFIEELDKAPEFDGHTSQDVLERLKTLISTK